MHLYIDQELKGAKTDKQITAAIERGFDRCEKEWLEMAKLAFPLGYPKTAYVGACALVAIVHDEKLFIANAGDCKGVLLSKNDAGDLTAKKLSTTFNANKDYEQERLKNEHPGEADIFHCYSKESCYVKGGLQPTRSFGDLRIKHAEFNNHYKPPGEGYRKPIPNFKGPYVSHKPDIKVFELGKDDQWLVLASDGLWDHLGREESAAIATKGLKDDLKKKQSNANQVLMALMN